MQLWKYPRPPEDNGVGMVFSASCYIDPGAIGYWVGRLVAMGVKWCKIMDNCAGSSVELAKALLAAGIMPVVRLYKGGALPDGYSEIDLACLPLLKAVGVTYVQLLCEPNLACEWDGNSFAVKTPTDRVQDAARAWAWAAERVLAAGLLPGLFGLAPGGNQDDNEFLRDVLDWLIKNGKEGLLLDRGWIGVHNYTLNHPPDYAKDSNCFRKFRWYHNILREQLEAHGLDPNLADDVPILSLEGGTVVGNHDDATFPEVTVETHAAWTEVSCRYMQAAEVYYFCTAFWIMANNRLGHWDSNWESQAWFSDRWPAGQLPTVVRLEGLRLPPRPLPQPTPNQPANPAPGGDHVYMEIGNHYRVIDRRANLPRNGAYPRRDLGLVKWIAIHHSGVPGDSSAEAIARYHVQTNGWPGAGYHLLIHPDGTTELLNDLDRACFNVAYKNAEVIGVCLAGDFGQTPPTPAQLAAARRLVAELQYTLGWFCPAVGHREIADPRSPTNCPGSTWPQWKATVEVLKPADGSAPYRYVLGFQDLAQRLGPDVVGAPVENEHRVSIMRQQTARGVMLYEDGGQPQFYNGPV